MSFSKFVNRGDFQSHAHYSPGDVVRWNNRYYVCRVECQGMLPKYPTWWFLLSR